MHKILIVFVSFCMLYSCTGSDQKSEDVSQLNIAKDSSNLLPDEIRDLPVGIEVWHEPDTLRAVVFEKDTSRYIWKHQTFVKALVPGLKITEFGTYNYKNGEWVLGNLNNKKYGAQEWGMWYFVYDPNMIQWNHAEGIEMKKDVVYFDPSNYSIKNHDLVTRNGLWYFIATDSTGKKYMGYGRYVALPELM